MLTSNFDPLGALLLKKNLISQEHLDAALKQQTIVKKKLGELLIEMKVLTEQTLLPVLSEQLAFAYIGIKDLYSAKKEYIEKVSIL